MDKYLKKSKKQIAFIFALASSGLILSATIVTMILVSYQMNQKADSLLTDNMNELLADYGTEKLVDKTISYQYDALDALSESSISSSREVSKEDLKNVIDDVQVISDDEVSDGDVIQQESHNIYSRIIDPDGYVLYTSDLFDNHTIAFREDGFDKTQTMDICIYSHTYKITSGEYIGTTLQIAEFCQITARQQISLGMIMVAIAFVASVFAYVIGLFTAKKILQPLMDSVNHTKKFTQNAYHELLTPISVALSTVESSIKVKKYKEGLYSVLEDLKLARKSLQFLKSHALNQKNDIKNEKIVIAELLQSEIDGNKDIDKDKKLDISIMGDLKKSVVANRDAVKIVFSNLISNVYKYTPSDGVVEILIDSEKCIIKNSISKDSKVDSKQFFVNHYKENKNSEGLGVGLVMVKSLVEDLGWRIMAEVKNGCIIVKVNYY